MTDDSVLRSESPPPAAEHIHLPGPSFHPVLVALGVTIALVGIVVSIPVAILGILLMFISLAKWIRESREDISELPLEH